jgi:hypothetical protein
MSTIIVVRSVEIQALVRGHVMVEARQVSGDKNGGQISVVPALSCETCGLVLVSLVEKIKSIIPVRRKRQHFKTTSFSSGQERHLHHLSL